MIGLEFAPWHRFRAIKDLAEKRRYFQAVGDAGVAAFQNGMGSYPGASAPGAWPNSRTGKLKSTIKAHVTDDSVTISTNAPYSMFLRAGTSKMARRKMSDTALEEGKKAARLGHWVHWTRF